MELEERAYKARRFELKQAQWDKKIKEFASQQFGALRRIRDLLHSHMRTAANGAPQGRQPYDENAQANVGAEAQENDPGQANNQPGAEPGEQPNEPNPNEDETANELPHQQQLVQLWREFERVRATDSGNSSEAEATGLTNEQPIQHRAHAETSERVAHNGGTATSSEQNNAGHVTSVHDNSRVASNAAMHTTANNAVTQMTYVPLRALSQADVV
eukprot:scaffold1369_cov396-Prasinococcus_capsulatus_cf.AAC.5